MATVAFALAALALCAGLALLWADKRAKQAPSRSQVVGEATANTPGSTTDPLADVTPPATPAPVTDATAVVYEDSEPLDVEVEESLAELQVQDSTRYVPPTPPEAEPGAVAATSTASTAVEEPRRRVPSLGATLLSTTRARRERRAWAREIGADFYKTNDYLDSEWSYGPAAQGKIHDIVSGLSRWGAEFHLFTAGDTTVLALRRGAESDIVVDIRRAGPAPEGLFAVDEVAGATVSATEQAPTMRLIDARVEAAITSIPASVEAVWLEGGWVLAQFYPESTAANWEEAIDPLTLLASASRVLPPAGGAARELDLEDVDPTRPLLPTPEVELAGVSTLPPRAPEAPVLRPAEPVPMPTRANSAQFGDATDPFLRAYPGGQLGGDEVEPIATGEEPPSEPDFYQVSPRVPRHLSGQSSIFTDTDPTETEN